MASDFAGAGITLNQSGPGIHVNVIERDTLKNLRVAHDQGYHTTTQYFFSDY